MEAGKSIATNIMVTCLYCGGMKLNGVRVELAISITTHSCESRLQKVWPSLPRGWAGIGVTILFFVVSETSLVSLGRIDAGRR